VDGRDVGVRCSAKVRESLFAASKSVLEATQPRVQIASMTFSWKDKAAGTPR
jgi:hypothetical protein